SFEEREMGGLRFRTWHLRDCAWEDDFDGETHIFYRRFPTSVRNLVARAMRKNDPWSISPKVTEKLRKEPDVMIKCLHVVMPAQFYYLDKLKPTEPWVSLYLDENHRWEMKVTQRRHFQYCVSRWFTVAGSPYAFSPSVVVSTPDARTLQAMTWSILEAGEKAVEPPLIATHEAVLSGVDIRAGHTTWIDKNYDERMGEAIRVLELGKHPELGEAIRQGVTGTLMEAWYLNRLFLPQFNHQMTAEETARRHEEFLRASQPIIDPAEEERNGKLLDPLAAFLMDRGYWGPPAEMPPELRNRHVDVTYDNPIEDARKQAKTMAFGQVVALTEQAKAIDPTAPAHLDTSKMFRDAVAGVAPPDWLVTEEEAQEAAKELEQQSTEQAGIEQAGQIASIAAEAAKAQPTQ
ncbi:MAG: portal protein, partial [Anaerolineales bacterium]